MSVDHDDDDFAVVQWENSAGITGGISGFYGNDCECEVVRLAGDLNVPCQPPAGDQVEDLGKSR